MKRRVAWKECGGGTAKTYKSVLGGIAVDRGGGRKADAFGCGNAGHGHVVDFHVDFGLRHTHKGKRECVGSTS